MESRYDNQVGGRLGKIVSPRLKLPQARAYKKFKVVEVFDVANTHCVLGSWIANHPGTIPYVTASADNNSIVRYVDFDSNQKERGNVIVIGGKTFVVTYQSKDFFSNDSHNLTLRLKEKSARKEEVYLFLVAVVKRSMGNKYSWGNSISLAKIQSDEILLPVISTVSSTPDFAFMEAYIRALEAERVRALEVYLKAAGYDDTELTVDEKNSLARLKRAKTATFKVGGDEGLFTIRTPPKRFNANAVKFGGDHPYVVRTSQNNGQRGCIIADESHLSEGNTISFGQDTATIFYQGRSYFTGDKIKVMKFKPCDLDERIAMFLLAAMRKSFSNFRWGSSSFDEKILKDVAVSLPVTPSGEIDFALMETFIRAIMKKSIADVVAWKDREIATTRNEGGNGGGFVETAQPWLVASEKVAQALRFREYLPLYSLRAACGKFGDGEAVECEGWVKVEGCGRLDERMFVVRASGRSMEPKIHNGDLCVMRANPQGSRQGKDVLAEHRDVEDPETGGAYSIKRYSSVKTAMHDGSWRHERIVLSPLNRGYDPIVIDEDSHGDCRIVAEVVKVLHSCSGEGKS